MVGHAPSYHLEMTLWQDWLETARQSNPTRNDHRLSVIAAEHLSRKPVPSTSFRPASLITRTCTTFKPSSQEDSTEEILISQRHLAQIRPHHQLPPILPLIPHISNVL
jgi:hypothetical protein